MKRIAIVVALFAVAAGFDDLGFAELGFADLKVGTTYTIGAAAFPGSSHVAVPTSSPAVVPASSSVMPTSSSVMPASSSAVVPASSSVVVPTPSSSVVVPTFRSALRQQPGKAEGRNPRLFAPQDLGLLEPPDREAWQKPDQVMDALHVAEGTTVVDLGAGGGWFTMRLARRVGPNGRVYAVDVQRLMIEAISRRIEREGLTHIVKPVLGQFTDPRLPPEARPDAVLTVDTFHEMRDQDQVLMLENVARTLKPQGRIGIIDYREGEGGPGPDSVERVGPSVVISQAAAAGLKLVEQHKFLPYQYFLIFEK